MEDIRDIIKKQKKRQEFLKQDKQIAEQKKKREEFKEENGKEIGIAEIPKIRVIQIPMKNIEFDKLEDLSIDYLRDLHKEIFGYSAPRDKGHGKVWIANKIRASFKTK